MSIKNYDIVDNKMANSDVWDDFGLTRMKLDDAIEQEMDITQNPIRIGSYCDMAMQYCQNIAIRFLQTIFTPKNDWVDLGKGVK
jgi:hypothetical protein